MKIAFLGDSITEGCCASKVENNFVFIVGKELGIEALNYGVGGTRIARQIGVSNQTIWDYDFNLRLSVINDDVDYIFVFGGTNDFGHGDAPIGSLSDNSVYTFCGALNTLCNTLNDRFGKDKVRFILPLPRFNENNPRGDGNKTSDVGVLSDYINIEKQILDKFGFEYICLDNLFYHPKACEQSELFFDGLHPNDKGYMVIANYLIDYIKKMSN